MPATIAGACSGERRFCGADSIVCSMMPVAKSKARSGVTPPSWPSRAARSMSSLSRLRATLATLGIAAALCATSAPQAGSRSVCTMNAPHPAAMRSIGSSSASAARLQEFVEFARQFVGDDALQLGEAVEVHIESALRHAGGSRPRHPPSPDRRGAPHKASRAAASNSARVRALRSRPICARRARSIRAISPLSDAHFHIDYIVKMTI